MTDLKVDCLSHKDDADGSRGESKLGSFNSDWIESRIVRTSYNAVHLSFKMSKQMLPSESMLGWKQVVMNVTLGAT